jgi:hypothetical protein
MHKFLIVQRVYFVFLIGLCDKQISNQKFFPFCTNDKYRVLMKFSFRIPTKLIKFSRLFSTQQTEPCTRLFRLLIFAKIFFNKFWKIQTKDDGNFQFANSFVWVCNKRTFSHFLVSSSVLKSSYHFLNCFTQLSLFY